MSISKIAEVTHQSRHTALVLARETDYFLDLRPLLIPVGGVGFAPRTCAGLKILRGVDDRASVDPQFFDCLVDQIGIHSYLSLGPGFLYRLLSQSGHDFIEHFHARVIALEKEIVRVPVRVGMHQHRSTRLTIASGSPDFLVTSFEAARQSHPRGPPSQPSDRLEIEIACTQAAGLRTNKGRE